MNILGLKYFRYINETDDKPEILRVIGFSDANTVRVKINGEKRKIKYEELKKYYVRLNPDGHIMFSLVSIAEDTNLLDTIVAFAKSEDTMIGNNIPCIVCRQNITDMYAMLINNDNKHHVGCTATPSTMPDDKPYEIMFSCNYIKESELVNVYMDDELDDILECIKYKKYNIELQALFEDSIKSFDNKSKEICRKNNYNAGYVTTLKSLLETNSFMSEFYIAFNIIKIGFIIDPDNVSLFVVNHIQQVFKVVFESLIFIEYDKDIDLKQIYAGRYILIKDIKNILYVVLYTSNKELNFENIDYNLLFKVLRENTKLLNEL